MIIWVIVLRGMPHTRLVVLFSPNSSVACDDNPLRSVKSYVHSYVIEAYYQCVSHITCSDAYGASVIFKLQRPDAVTICKA